MILFITTKCATELPCNKSSCNKHWKLFKQTEIHFPQIPTIILVVNHRGPIPTN